MARHSGRAHVHPITRLLDETSFAIGSIGVSLQERDLTEAIALAYEAGADPERWPLFLEKVATTIADGSSGLQIQDLGRDEGSFAFAVLADPAYIDAYEKHFAALNPWTRLGAPKMQPGLVIYDEMVLSTRQLKKTEFYGDFLRPQGIAHSLAGVIDREGDITAFVSFCRSARRGPWTADEIGLLANLMPHLQRAVQIHRRLGSERLQHEALVETADRLPWGVLFLDTSRRVVFENEWARNLDKHVRAEISVVANAGGGLVRRKSRAPLRVTVATLAARDPIMRERPALVVFIVDPDARPPTPEKVLRDAHRLTRAEARLALALGEGSTLVEIADQTGVSASTLRTHLKRVFEKTGTCRQSELVRLVLLLSGVD
jgi:DNA-binding CsgD family transcriptional regulator